MAPTQTDRREEQRAVLLKLREEDRLTARSILDEARDPNNPLHEAFTWDDHSAAEAHRRTQAGALIREFKQWYRVEHGRVVKLANNLQVQPGKSVELREFYTIRPGASEPTEPVDEPPSEDTEEEAPAHQQPRDTVTLSDLQADRNVKREAAATFFRLLRGYRGQCYLYEDIDADFAVIAKAIDRISGRLEAGKFGEEQTRQDRPLFAGATDGTVATA
jgi:hypothetical protein